VATTTPSLPGGSVATSPAPSQPAGTGSSVGPAEARGRATHDHTNLILALIVASTVACTLVLLAAGRRNHS